MGQRQSNLQHSFNYIQYAKSKLRLLENAVIPLLQITFFINARNFAQYLLGFLIIYIGFKELFLAFLPRRIVLPLWNRVIVGTDGTGFRRFRFLKPFALSVMLFAFGDIWEFIQVFAALAIGFSSFVFIFNLNEYNFIHLTALSFTMGTFSANENQIAIN